MLVTQLQQLNLASPIAIIGAGITGKSFFNLLQLADIDAQVFDERDALPVHFCEHADSVTLGEFQANTFTDFGTIMISPGLDARRECFAPVQDRLLTDIELFARLTEKPVIGVTGSNGKSTVVTLIHEVCQLAQRDYVLCGNIGLSVLQALVENEATCEGYIIELSSYQLERAPSLKPAIGVWLNVSPDHLDRYDSYDSYVATKAKLFTQSTAIIVNADDTRVSHYAKKHSNPSYFSQTQESAPYHFIDGKLYRGQDTVFELAHFSQIGTHHADNLMAVFAVTEKLAIDTRVTAKACKDFKPLASRSVVVAKHQGLTFINDSKGTNIGATSAAIKGITSPIVLLAGGQGKGQDFSTLANAAQGHVKTAVFFGQDASTLKKAMLGKVSCECTNDLASAFKLAVQAAEAGDVVMLSPACASFDQFESYLKRGECFEQLVMEWIDAQ